MLSVSLSPTYMRFFLPHLNCSVYVSFSASCFLLIFSSLLSRIYISPSLLSPLSIVFSLSLLPLHLPSPTFAFYLYLSPSALCSFSVSFSHFSYRFCLISLLVFFRICLLYLFCVLYLFIFLIFTLCDFLFHFSTFFYFAFLLVRFPLLLLSLTLSLLSLPPPTYFHLFSPCFSL